MEFLELELANFKRFKEKKLSFSPGLNLIFGPNESGKSTIYEALCCALFGRERGKAVESWNGNDCSVMLAYLADGKTYHLDRRLAQGAATLSTFTDGTPSDTVSGKDQVEAHIALHTGISSRGVFENTVSVRQLGMSKLSPSDLESVGGEIERLLTGTSHASATEIIKRLEASRDAVIGRARPANPREYDTIIERLRRSAEDLADARRSRDHIKNLETEQAALQDRIACDTERLQAVGSLLDRHKRWLDLKNREGRLDAQHKEVFATLSGIKNSLTELSATNKELTSYADLVGKDEEIGGHLSRIAGRREELEDRISELDAAGEDQRRAFGGALTPVILAGAVLFTLAGLVLGTAIDARAYLLLLPGAVFAVRYAQIRAAGASIELRHVCELINSAREELAQLSMEEKGILSYCNSADPAQAWSRIKAYRRLASRARELELSISLALGDHKPEDIEAQEAELARELSGVKRELEDEFEGYQPSTEESESWRAESAALQLSLPRAEARLHQVSGALESERRNARDLASLTGEIEFLHQRKEELEFLHKAYGVAIDAITEVTKSVTDEYLPELCQKAGDCLSLLTGGRYASIAIQPGGKISVDCPEKTSVPPASLSAGAADQLYLTVRLAFAEMLSHGHRLPLIMDDPFANFDRNRLANVLHLLSELAAKYQIMLFTHDPYTLDTISEMERGGKIPCRVHKLAASGEIDS